MALLRILLCVLFVAKLCSSQCNGGKDYDARYPGEITSPSYDSGKYPDDQNCLYIITAPERHRIKITFLDVDIAPSTSCVGDMLAVHSHMSQTYRNVFCGSGTPRPILSDEGENKIVLSFNTHTDASRAVGSTAGRGFKLRYESAPDMALCPSHQGECKNRNCYDVNKVCDGKDDCGDGTDEEGCTGTPETVECGSTPIKPDTIYGAPDRLVGGETAVPNSWPWHASIQKIEYEPNGHFCAGTLINAQWVLTAARCFLNAPFPSSIRVVVGAHRLFGKTEYEQVRIADKIISYPDLENEELMNANPLDDLALVKLNAPVKFNDGVRPACLPYGHWMSSPGWQCYTTGWGEIQGAGFSDELKQTVFELKAVENCTHDDEKEICVEFPKSAPCEDDYGSPLVCRLAGSWYLLGSASRSVEGKEASRLCHDLESKILFTRIAQKADWVRKTIGEDEG